MKHEILQKQGASVIVFQGEIDLESSPAARETLLKCFGNTGNVIVDLSGVTYIDSSGIASLVEGYQSARTEGVKFCLVDVSEAALGVLELARLNKVFPIVASVEECMGGTG